MYITCQHPLCCKWRGQSQICLRVKAGLRLGFQGESRKTGGDFSIVSPQFSGHLAIYSTKVNQLLLRGKRSSWDVWIEAAFAKL